MKFNQLDRTWGEANGFNDAKTVVQPNAHAGFWHVVRLGIVEGEYPLHTNMINDDEFFFVLDASY